MLADTPAPLPGEGLVAYLLRRAHRHPALDALDTSHADEIDQLKKAKKAKRTIEWSLVHVVIIFEEHPIRTIDDLL